MADAPFQPDARYEKILELLDRAMKGDKEILGQIIRRGGFSKEELAPIQEYATRKWAAKGEQSRQVSPQDLDAVQKAGASPQDIEAYRQRVAAPVDIGAQYSMFLRDEPATPPAPTKATKPVKKAPKSKPPVASKLDYTEASTDEAKLGKAALKMLEGIAGGGGGGGGEAPASQPVLESRVPMPNTVIDPYGRPIDSPADQLPPTDDPAEINRRIEEGKRRRAELQQSYKRAAGNQ